jgi:hypothetical protein
LDGHSKETNVCYDDGIQSLRNLMTNSWSLLYDAMEENREYLEEEQMRELQRKLTKKRSETLREEPCPLYEPEFLEE